MSPRLGFSALSWLAIYRSTAPGLDLISRCAHVACPLLSGPCTDSCTGPSLARPGWVSSAVRTIRFMLDSLTLPPLPTLPGERVILREPRTGPNLDRQASCIASAFIVGEGDPARPTSERSRPARISAAACATSA